MFKNYLKIAFRNFLKYKTYSLINLLGLIIGFSACLVIALYVINELSYDSLQDANLINRIVTNKKTSNDRLEYATTPSSLVYSLKNDFPQVKYAARIITNPEQQIKVNEKNFSESRVFHCDSDIFKILNFSFIYGNPNTCLSKPKSIVITKDISEKYFGNVNPLGKTLDFGYSTFEITGVIKPLVNTHLKLDFLISLKPFESRNWQDQGWADVDGQSSLVYTYIKFTKDFDRNIFSRQLNGAIAKYPGTADLSKTMSFSLQPVKDIHLYSNRLNEIEAPGNIEAISILGIIALVILIIACINFINLSTARNTSRVKEIGVRKTSGAFRSQIIKQFFVESVLFTTTAFLISLIITDISLPAINSLTNKTLALSSLSYSQVILLIVFVFILGCSAGIYPALAVSSVQPVNILKGFSAGNISNSLLRKILVVLQFTFAIILISGTVIIFKQIHFLKNYDLGFDKNNLIALPIPAGKLFNKESEEYISNEFQKHSSVISASTTSYIPGMDKNIFKGKFKLAENNYERDINIMIIDPDFLTTYSIKLSTGRALQNNTDNFGRTCLINESAVKSLGLHSPQEAIGKHLFDFDEREIVGVIKDFHFSSLRNKIEPLFLSVNPDFYIYLTLKFNKANLNEAMNFTKDKWNELFPGNPFQYYFFDDIIDKQYKAEANFSSIILAFTVLAIFLACLGLYGIISFVVACRTKEIGIRKVFGSSASQIISVLVKDFTGWILVAGIISVPVSYYIFNSWLQNYAYRTNINWWIFILACGFALLISIATVSLKIIKAATANPVESLKYE